jgi:hypothetical protein
LVFVALRDVLGEALVIAVVEREILESVEHDNFGGWLAVEVASELAALEGFLAFR